MSDKLTLFFVNATFVALVAGSALTWAIVIVKALQLRRVTRQSDALHKVLEKLQGLPSQDELARHDGPVARVARVGTEAWTQDATGEDGEARDVEIRKDLLERSLKGQLQKERRAAESGLSILASIGSTAPFIGLFGTVLGIVHALQAISGSASASLEIVAGPIGEALIATALGIAVAVPAVLAYNYFLRKLKTFTADLDEFANAFVGTALRVGHVRDTRAPSNNARGRLELRQEVSA